MVNAVFENGRSANKGDIYNHSLYIIRLPNPEIHILEYFQ